MVTMKKPKMIGAHPKALAMNKRRKPNIPNLFDGELRRRGAAAADRILSAPIYRQGILR